MSIQKKFQGGNSTVLMLVIVIIILVIVGIIFAGWWWYKNYYKNTWQDNPNVPTTTQTTISKTAETQEQTSTKLNNNNSTFYQNIRYGYGLNYPNNWKTQGATQESDLAQFYTDSIDIINKGALVSISSVKDTGDIIDIRKWSSSQPVGDPEGAASKANEEYITKEGMTYLKNENPSSNSLTYYWICGFRVMTITYQATSEDYDKYLLTFNAVFDTLIPCAE